MRLLIRGLFIILQMFVLAVDGNIVQCVALAASWFKVCLVRREQLSHWTTWSVCMCQFYVIVSLDDVDILLIHRKNGSSLVWVGAVGPRLLSFYNVYVCVYLSVQVGAFALETKKLVTVSWCQRRRFEGKLGCKSGPLPPPPPFLTSPHHLLHVLEGGIAEFPFFSVFSCAEPLPRHGEESERTGCLAATVFSLWF